MNLYSYSVLSVQVSSGQIPPQIGKLMEIADSIRKKVINAGDAMDDDGEILDCVMEIQGYRASLENQHFAAWLLDPLTKLIGRLINVETMIQIHACGMPFYQQVGGGVIKIDVPVAAVNELTRCSNGTFPDSFSCVHYVEAVRYPGSAKSLCGIFIWTEVFKLICTLVYYPNSKFVTCFEQSLGSYNGTPNTQWGLQMLDTVWSWLLCRILTPT